MKMNIATHQNVLHSGDMLLETIAPERGIEKSEARWTFWACLLVIAFATATNSVFGQTATPETPHKWTALFNGKDLSGWEQVDKGSFVVEDGLLKSQGGMGLLYYKNQAFENTVIRVVYKSPDQANSGVFIRIPEPPKDAWEGVNKGYEVQIQDGASDGYHQTGVLYSLTKAGVSPGKPDAWNTMEITLDGPRTLVHINGELVTDFKEGDEVPEKKIWYEPERGPRPNKGFIGLQNHGDEDVVYFKEVSYRSLPVHSSDPHGRNHDEALVRPYSLPDPLLSKDGQRVADSDAWNATRRSEILGDFRDLMYGHTPDLSTQLQAEVVGVRKDAIDGLATRTLVRLRFFDDPSAPCINLMLYVPNVATKPVPVFLGMNFLGNASVENDPSIPLPEGWMNSFGSSAVVDNHATESLRGMKADRWSSIAAALKRGYGVATFFYGDVEPDHIEGWRNGIRGYALKRAGRTERTANEWGAIGAWAWGLSRAIDYLQTNPAVDARRAVVFGHSRLGKAALWAGAQDERFAVVISNNSGEGGASLARRNFGENIAQSIAHASWRYCDRFRDYIHRENDLPFDQHMLLALIAPRPIYVSSATKDLTADPQGEFLSAVHAEPVYQLFGRDGVNTSQWPAPDKSVGQTIGYHVRTGKHNLTAFDWEQFLNFADRHTPGE